MRTGHERKPAFKTTKYRSGTAGELTDDKLILFGFRKSQIMFLCGRIIERKSITGTDAAERVGGSSWYCCNNWEGRSECFF